MPRPVPPAAGAHLALIVAILAGTALGLFGAWRNGVRFADERLLWALGGGLGAGIEWRVGAWQAGTFGATLALAAWTAGSLLAAWWSPRLDASRSRGAQLASFLLKTSQCPLTTGTALLAAILLGRGRPRWRLRGGACYAEAGEGRRAVALGGVVLAQRGMLGAGGDPPDWVVHHESHHTRNAACLGECGYYVLYATVGAAWALFRGAPWNGLAADGRGNPFERTAYALGRAEDEATRA